MLILATFYITLLLVLFVLVSLMLSAVILIQKPRGGGLTGAFGGAGGGAQSAFGSRTGDFLTWFTVSCFVAFLLLAMGLTWAIRPPTELSEDKDTIKTTTPPPPASQPAVPEAEAPEVPESPLPATAPAAGAPSSATTAPATTPEAKP